MRDEIAGLSECRGPTDAVLIEKTIGACFAEGAERNCDRLALVERRRSIRWSWRELRDQAEAAALGLLALGLAPGDRIGVGSPNCVEWAALQFAAARAGLVLVGLNPALRAEELSYAIDKVECAALACAPSLLALWRGTSSRLLISLAEGQEADVVSFDALLAAGAGLDRGWLAEIEERARPEDPAMIQFTSGTTGPPKAATLSHRNVVNSAFFGGERLGITERDRVCVPVPLFHAFGSIGGNLMAAMRGAAVIYPSATFDPGQVFAATEEERCTALYGVPAMYGAMLAHPRFSKTDVNSLRTGIIAGSPCSPALMKRVIEEMHLPELVTAFGMTETSAAGLATARDDPIERRLASVGRVTAHTELKIVDETGAVVPRGVPGELLTRGFSVMRGYWGDPVATAEVIDAEGWMHTGDLVSIDAEGWGTVHGRVRDVINVAGEKVLPGEVEAVLMRHPAVEMAAVFGIPDEARGEVVCACVKPRSGRNVDDIELKAFCRERLTNFKIPRSFGFVEQIPMTATGKIRKFLVKTEYLAPKP